VRRVLISSTIAILALIYVAPALQPGHVMVPMDIPQDLLAWKGDPAVRVRVSNSLLSDVPLQLVPWDMESRRLIASGQMPWRNRFAGDGSDLFASPLAALLSPFTWPRLAIGLQGWEWTVLLKLLVAAASMWWLARLVARGRRAGVFPPPKPQPAPMDGEMLMTGGRTWGVAQERVFGFNTLGPFLSAIIFAFSGYSIVWALYPHTNVFVLLPALAAAALLLSRGVTPGRVLALGAIAALATAGGHPETLFIGVLAIAVWLIFADARRKVPVALAALGGFLLVGIQLLPFALILGKSYVIVARGEQLGSYFRQFSIASLVLPGYLGSPLKGELDLTGMFAGAENFNQRSGAFIGALSLLAIALAWRHLSRVIKAGAVIAGVALGLSLSIPGISHTLHPIPLFGWTAPEYYAVAFVVFAALAAGPALAHVILSGARKRIGTWVFIIGLVTFIGGSLPTVVPGPLETAANETIETLRARGHLNQAPEVYQARLAGYLAAAQGTALRRVALPGLCWAVFGLAIMLPPSTRRTLIGGAAVVAELMVFGWGYNPAIRSDDVVRPPQMLQQVRHADPDGRWSIAAGHEVFPPNLSTLWRVHDVHSYDILTSRRQAVRLAPAGYDPLRWTLPATPSPEQMTALGKLGVRFYLTPEGLIQIPGAVDRRPVANVPPEGIWAGLGVSLAGALLLFGVAIWARGRASADG